jgi:hypothetical protein
MGRALRSRAAQALRAAAALIGVAALGASCLVAGFDMVDTAVVGGGGGGSAPDAGDDVASGGQSAGCAHATWPAPPASADPGVDSVDFVAAVRSMNFGEDDLDNGPTVGYDLDNRCTCQGEESSCNVPEWATADHCDGPEGRDNAASQLFAWLTVFASNLSSQQQSEAAEQGDWSLLIRVRDYNGQANDDRVTLSLYPSPGLDKDPCLEPTPTPNWDGNDRWPIPAHVLGGYVGGGGVGGGQGQGGCGGTGGSEWDVDDAVYTDVNAYVTDWTVVANLPEAGMVLSSGGTATPLNITAGFITARIEQVASGWALRDGIFAGRWRISDFFEMLSTIENAGSYLCTDHPVYDAIKSAVCEYPDIAAELAGPTTPCDALSFGMGLEADPAQIGVVLESPTAPSECPPGTDPADDQCGTP